MPTVQTIERLWLSERIRMAMESSGSAAFPDEVGGILAGYRNGADAVVCALIGPGPDAVGSTVSFTPDGEFQAKEMARIYTESSGRFEYLGDWHTHPRGTACLSALDIRTLRSIGRAKHARCETPLMLVFAGGPENWKVAAFTLGPKQWKYLRDPVPVELTTYAAE